MGIIGAIVAAATTVVKTLSVAGLALQGLKAIANVLTSLGKALGLIKTETKVDELGDKALQSGYNPDDFDSYAEYVKEVEKFDDLDPEKSKSFSENEKLEKGMELAVGATIENFEGFPIDEFCIAVGQNPEFFTPDKMDEIGKLMQADGQHIPSILNFLNGSEKDTGKNRAAFDTLVKIEKTVNPSISEKDAYRSVLQARK